MVTVTLTNRYGVNPEQLSYDGVGPLVPLAANKDESGRALNRRVEIIQF